MANISSTEVKTFALDVQSQAHAGIAFEQKFILDLVNAVLTEESVSVEEVIKTKRMDVNGTAGIRKLESGETEIANKALQGQCFDQKFQPVLQTVADILVDDQRKFVGRITDQLEEYSKSKIVVDPEGEAKAIRAKTWTPNVSA